MVQPAKTDKVDYLKDLLKNAKCIILNDFTGLNVADISELRRLCRENGIIFKVVKNTLAKRSFREMGLEEVEPLLEGPTALAVSDTDELGPAKVLKSFADDYEFPRFKGGYISGRVFSEAEVLRLASLPGKEVLLVMVLEAMQAPLRGLVNCLGASLRDLVFVLKAISEKKGAA